MAVSKILGHLPGLLHYRYAGCVHNCSRTLSRHSPRSGQPATSPSPDISDIGTESLSSVIDPLQHEDFFGVNKLVNMKHLFDSGVHLGHKSGTRNVHMRPYLFGTRLGVDILDLNHTLPLLKEAMNFTAHIAYREGIIMFISRNKQTFPIVERAATDCGEYSHCRRWQLGTFTNATKEFGSITRLPDLCIFISTHDSVFEQHLGVVEAAKCNIPTIAILDTSCDGKLITYPVPGNDDSPSAVQLYCNLFKEAVLLGKNKLKEMQQIKEEQ